MRYSFHFLLLILTVSMITLGCEQQAQESAEEVTMPVGQTEAESSTASTQTSSGQTASGQAASTQPAGTEESGGAHDMAQGGGEVMAAGIAFSVPSGWVREQPENQMRLAQFRLEGDAGAGEMVIYYFGPNQGGGTVANIQRWLGQFSNTNNADGDVQSMQSNNLKITTVRTVGTYDPGMAMADMEPQDDYALYGAILEGGPQGTLFLKATGPNATIQAHEDAIAQFISGAHTH